jgi:hypothetical protein
VDMIPLVVTCLLSETVGTNIRQDVFVVQRKDDRREAFRKCQEHIRTHQSLLRNRGLYCGWSQGSRKERENRQIYRVVRLLLKL